jgi:C4-dicarboxylate transporter, DctM subunit
MSSELIGLFGVVLVLILLFARMWIGAAMAMVGFIGTAYLQGIAAGFSVAGMVPYESIATYVMSPLPMFVLMGVIVGATRLGEELYDTAYNWIGQMRGGLASATIVASALIAAISGSGVTATIIMAKTALPEMKKHGYDSSLATGSIASAGTLGILIPPSVAFILYALITEQSVGTLYMAGLIPGILLTIAFICTVSIMTTINPRLGPKGPKTAFKAKIISLKNSWYILVLFILVLGGIYIGIFTATEAGAVGVFGALVIAAVKRRLNRKNIVNIFMESVEFTGMILLLLVGAFMFTKFLGVSELPFMITDMITNLSVSKYIILVIIILIYVVLGMFLDIYSAILLTIPITYPIVMNLGFDPIWYGVMIVMLVELGLITPPIGMNVFTLSGMTDIKVGTIFYGVLPFCIAVLVCMVLIIIFPDIALFLPYSMTVR